MTDPDRLFAYYTAAVESFKRDAEIAHWPYGWGDIVRERSATTFRSIIEQVQAEAQAAMPCENEREMAGKAISRHKFTVNELKRLETDPTVTVRPADCGRCLSCKARAKLAAQ